MGVTDPVVAGLVESLSRPGGNTTGITNIAAVLTGKRLELLKATLPGLSRVAVLWDPQAPGSVPQWQESQLRARELGLQLHSMEVSSVDAYEAAFSRASNDPEAFWAEAAEAVDWQRRWTEVLDRSRAPFYRWFPGALLNTCQCAVDRHANGSRANQLALIYDSPVTNTVLSLTYRELRDNVARVAGALRSLGVAKGDRVLIFMPNTPEGTRSIARRIIAWR